MKGGITFTCLPPLWSFLPPPVASLPFLLSHIDFFVLFHFFSFDSAVLLADDSFFPSVSDWYHSHKTFLLFVAAMWHSPSFPSIFPSKYILTFVLIWIYVGRLSGRTAPSSEVPEGHGLCLWLGLRPWEHNDFGLYLFRALLGAYCFFSFLAWGLYRRSDSLSSESQNSPKVCDSG